MSDPAIIPATLPPQSLRFDRTIFVFIIILLFFVTVVFSGLATCNFINLDDGVYVTNNPHVTGGLGAKDIAWAWTSVKPAGYWIPITWMSLQLDGSLSDPTVPPSPPNVLPDAPKRLPNASVYHIDNILQHGIAAVLLFLFLWRATGMRWPAFAATILWAVHPLRVESVAWVTERKDVLAAVFGFLAMLLYVEWTRRGRWWRYAACALAFALSVMSKPLFVTLPVLLVLVDFWPLARLGGRAGIVRRIAEKWALWIIAIAGSVLVYITQGEVKAVIGLRDITLAQRLGHALVSYVGYLRSHVQVWSLGLVYPYEKSGAGEIMLCAAILLAITALCAWQVKRRPWFLVGWLWYLVAMAPMIGLVQSGDQGSADRFTYLPAVGIFIMVIFGAFELWQKAPRARLLLAPAAAALLIFFAAFSVWQASFWSDTVTLMLHSLVVARNNVNNYGTLGTAYLSEGKNKQAAEEYRKAVEVKPDFAPAWLSLGYIDMEMGKINLALPELQKAADLEPDLAGAWFWLGYTHLGTGDFNKALIEMSKAAKLNPNDERTRKLYGFALAKKGYMEDTERAKDFYMRGAEHEFEAAVSLDPKDAEAARYLNAARRELARGNSSPSTGPNSARQSPATRR